MEPKASLGPACANDWLVRLICGPPRARSAARRSAHSTSRFCSHAGREARRTRLVRNTLHWRSLSIRLSIPDVMSHLKVVVDDALLDLVETVMIIVENLLGKLEVLLARRRRTSRSYDRCRRVSAKSTVRSHDRVPMGREGNTGRRNDIRARRAGMIPCVPSQNIRLKKLNPGFSKITPKIGVNISAFPACLEEKREVRTATGISRKPRRSVEWKCVPLFSTSLLLLNQGKPPWAPK